MQATLKSAFLRNWERSSSMNFAERASHRYKKTRHFNLPAFCVSHPGVQPKKTGRINQVTRICHLPCNRHNNLAHSPSNKAWVSPFTWFFQQWTRDACVRKKNKNQFTWITCCYTRIELFIHFLQPHTKWVYINRRSRIQYTLWAEKAGKLNYLVLSRSPSIGRKWNMATNTYDYLTSLINNTSQYDKIEHNCSTKINQTFQYKKIRSLNYWS